MLGFILGLVVGVGLCVAAALFYPKPWLKLLKETGEEVKR